MWRAVAECYNDGRIDTHKCSIIRVSFEGLVDYYSKPTAAVVRYTAINNATLPSSERSSEVLTDALPPDMESKRQDSEIRAAI